MFIMIKSHQILRSLLPAVNRIPLSLTFNRTHSSDFLVHGLCRVLSSCSLCGQRKDVRNFHSSIVLSKKRKTREDKNLVSLNPKALKISKKKAEEVVSIWRNITVKQLAKTLNKDLDSLFEIFLYIKGSDMYDDENSKIDNIFVITEAVKKSGKRYTIDKAPDLFEDLFKEDIKDKDAFRRQDIPESALLPRHPIVTIMGHVDHGKTTLLDALRHTQVVKGEFGGITQHIGAFTVRLDSGERVTFLDTPGHAAFSAMRARGANVTDLVVLVVAADDGVMEQTKESIRFAREANVPIIVAINKIDKPGADVDATRDMLLRAGIQLECSGGDVQSVGVSALKGLNLEQLVEALVMQADMLNLRADPRGPIEGFVVESRIEHGRGKVATCIVKHGTLRKGSVLVAGTSWAKVRGMFDDNGRPVQLAPPSTAVQIIGWRNLPSAGDEVLEVESEKRANEVVTYRNQLENEKKQEKDEVFIKAKLQEHLKQYQETRDEKLRRGWKYKIRNRGFRPKETEEEDPRPRVSIVLKGDVDGSVEAILDVLDTYHSEECLLDIISYGVGNITETDITLASTFNGSIITFNVDVPDAMARTAKTQDVQIFQTNIIYRVIEYLKEELSEKLPLKDEQEILGEANVLAEFLVTENKKEIPVAGCRCNKGALKKDAHFRVIRGQDVIHEGPLSSMRHHKSEVDSINTDKECGLMFKDEEMRFESGDAIICYKINKIKQTTDWDPGF